MMTMIIKLRDLPHQLNRHRLKIYSLDKDFVNYAQYIPIQLFTT